MSGQQISTRKTCYLSYQRCFCWGIEKSYKIVAILVTFLEFSEDLFIDQYAQMHQSELDYINCDTMLRLHMHGVLKFETYKFSVGIRTRNVLIS